MRDPHARKSLLELLPEGPRVFPVGRLDRDSEGLLLLTNDGELSHRLQHPRHGVEKEYLVEVEGNVSAASLRRLARGIELEDGLARALRVDEVQRRAGKTALSITLGEGRKREVRRMMEAIGHPVRRLVRIRMGPVLMGALRPGKLRPLDAEEVSELYRAAGLDVAAPRPGRRSGRGGESSSRGSGRGRGLSRDGPSEDST
jgi:23S rRNA pseudouridine2605 synthase